MASTVELTSAQGRTTGSTSLYDRTIHLCELIECIEKDIMLVATALLQERQGKPLGENDS